MKNNWIKDKQWVFWAFIVAPIAVAAFITIGGEVVKALWNALLPEIFGWKQITFWQALGLLVLCRILFGNMGGRFSNRSRSRPRLAELWDRMTPEEREAFRRGIGSQRADSGMPPAEPESR
jgi:hypothetical protein